MYEYEKIAIWKHLIKLGVDINRVVHYRLLASPL